VCPSAFQTVDHQGDLDDRIDLFGGLNSAPFCVGISPPSPPFVEFWIKTLWAHEIARAIRS